MNGESSCLAEPVRVVSDLHLAHPSGLVGEVEALRPLVRGAGTVVFNGDSYEESYEAWRARGRDMLAELHQLCAEEGAGAVFLPGNHDPGISPRGWLHLGGRGILVTHGHMIFDTGAPWTYEYLERKARIRAILEQDRDPGHDLGRRLETAQRIARALAPDRVRRIGRKRRLYVFSALWPPARLFHIARAWLTHARRAGEFLDLYLPETRVLIYGHFHRSGVWRRGSRWLVNTGAFMPGMRPLVVDHAAGRLTIRRVERSSARFAPGAILRTIDPLADNP